MLENFKNNKIESLGMIKLKKCCKNSFLDKGFILLTVFLVKIYNIL